MLVFIMRFCFAFNFFVVTAKSGRKPECQTVVFELLSVPLAISSIEHCKIQCEERFDDLYRSLWLPTQEDIRTFVMNGYNRDKNYQFNIDSCVTHRRYCVNNSDMWLSTSESPEKNPSDQLLSIEALKKVHAFIQTCSWQKYESAATDQSCLVRPLRSCICRRLFVMLVASKPMEVRACSHQDICKRLTVRFSSTSISQWICNRSFFHDEVRCGHNFKPSSCVVCGGRGAGDARGGPCFDATKLPKDLQDGLELKDLVMDDLPDTYDILFREVSSRLKDGNIKYRQFHPGRPSLFDPMWSLKESRLVDLFIPTDWISDSNREAGTHPQARRTNWIHFGGQAPWNPVPKAPRTPLVYASEVEAEVESKPEAEVESEIDRPSFPEASRATVLRYRGSSSRNPQPMMEETLISLTAAETTINTKQALDFLGQFDAQHTPASINPASMRFDLADIRDADDDLETATLLSLDDALFGQAGLINEPESPTKDKGKRKMDGNDDTNPNVDFFSRKRHQASYDQDILAASDIHDGNPFENAANHGHLLQLDVRDSTSVNHEPHQSQRTLSESIYVISSTTTAGDPPGAQPGLRFASLSSVVTDFGLSTNQPDSAENTQQEALDLRRTIL